MDAPFATIDDYRTLIIRAVGDGDEATIRLLARALVKGAEAKRELLNRGIWGLANVWPAVDGTQLITAQERWFLAETLTAREREVWELVARGWQDKEIAKVLGITTQVVRHYVGVILSTFGLSNRTQAALLYHGITTEPPRSGEESP
jgi:DNA-binding NarL/FixJ family response regulator